MACWRALDTLHDPRSADLLQLAHEQLQVRATSLDDAGAQRLFWSAPIHAEVQTAVGKRG